MSACIKPRPKAETGYAAKAMRHLDIITLSALGVLYGASFLLYCIVSSRARKRWASAIAILEHKVEALNSELDKLDAIDREVAEREQLSVTLYDFTKRMSGCLKFDEVASVLESFLREDLKEGVAFKKGELIVLKDSNGGDDIDRIYAFSSSGSSTQPLLARGSAYNVKKILALSMADKKGGPVSTGGLVVEPIMNENRLAAVLVMEGVREDDFERLGIITLQLALEMKKVMLYETVEYLSIVDGLTGLYGRRYFRDRLEEEVGRAKARGLTFSFIMADIDHFKKCNDTYGHLVGDVVLREIGRLIKESVRQIDLVARYGGEEFSAILPDTGKERAEAVAQRIRKRIEENLFRAYDEALKVTISIGVSAYPGDGVDSTAVIDAADKAVYKAKADGRNCVRVAT